MARDINRELLTLAEIVGEEQEQFLPIWKVTAEKLKLTEDVVTFAVDTYIPQNWDIKYKGVRMMIGAYLREIAEIVDTPNKKANGVKIVYGILPAIANYYYAVKEAGGDNVFIGFPDLMMVNTLNSFFHGAAPFLNEAEKQGFTYGCRHCPLNKMRVAAYTTGTIAAPDARTLVIQPWDGSLLKKIEKAIQVSDLGINPQNDGRVIRLVFPQLTEERRRELVKQVKKYGEDGKVAVRNIRRDAMDYIKKLKKDSEITEDDQKKAEKDLQDITDKYIKKVDEACAVKEKELMEL